MSESKQDLSRDDVFDLLSSARRRYILYYLRQSGGEASINELAAQIAVWENDVPREELTSQDEKRVYVSLYQTHVPKLDDQGIVEYDSDSGTVRLTDRAYQVDRYLSGDDGAEFPWQLYYLGVAVLGAAVYGLAVLGAGPFGAVPPVVVAGVLVVVFALSAAVQYLLGRYRRSEVPSELRIE